MVDPVHVTEVGPAAALLFARICWRADRDGFWKASRAVLVAETGLSPDSVRGALRVLRDRGWVKGERASRDDATMVWSPVFAGQTHVGNSPIGSGEFPHVPDRGNFPMSSLETVETTDTPAEADEPEESMQTFDDSDGALPLLIAVPDLPSDEGEKREAGPAKTAQTLVARWVDGYRETNGGADPPTPLMKRVAGQQKRLAASCQSHEDWVAAWNACHAAGRESRADAVPLLGRAVSRYPGRRNHDLDNLRADLTSGASSLPTSAALAMLPAPQTDPPT